MMQLESEINERKESLKQAKLSLIYTRIKSAVEQGESIVATVQSLA